MEEADPGPPPAAQLSLGILQTIRPAQRQNGLKHGDYGRYRQYCARRLRSLYKALKFLHGKGRYTKKKLESSMLTDVRYLEVVLVSAERSWAHAMELREEAGPEGDVAGASRKRQHGVRRLAKAALWAGMLARFAAERCDTRSSLEAEAYAAWMLGTLMERKSDWSGSLSKLGAAKKLYTELGKVGVQESQALCSSMVEEIEPVMRHCAYQLDRSGIELAERSASADGGDSLASKLANLAAEAAAASQAGGAVGSGTFEWRGQSHPVRHERVAQALAAAKDAEAALQAGSDAMDVDVLRPDGEEGVALGVEAMLSRHDAVANALSEARGAVRALLRSGDAARGGEGGTGGSDAEELSALEGAISCALLERAMQRGELAVADAAGRYEAAQARLAAGGATGSAAGGSRAGGAAAAGSSGRPVKPEDLLRLHEMLLFHAQELSELAGRLGGRAGEALMDACAARQSGYAAGRCYWGGHAYLASDKWAEAAALFERAADRAEEAVEVLEGLPRGEAAVRSALPKLKRLGADARNYAVVAAAELAAEGAEAGEGAARSVAGLALGGTTPSAAQPPQFLMDSPGSWDAYAGANVQAAPGRAGAAATRLASVPRVYSAPYSPQAVPTRPMMLDTAAGWVRYPNLAHRLRKLQKTSTFARMFGWGPSS